MGRINSFWKSFKTIVEFGDTMFNIKDTVDKMDSKIEKMGKTVDATSNEIGAVKLEIDEQTQKIAHIEKDIGIMKIGLQKELFNTLSTLRKQLILKGYATFDEKQQFLSAYEAYHNLGTNGWATQYLEQVMSLPESREEILIKGLDKTKEV